MLQEETDWEHMSRKYLIHFSIRDGKQGYEDITNIINGGDIIGIHQTHKTRLHHKEKFKSQKVEITDNIL